MKRAQPSTAVLVACVVGLAGAVQAQPAEVPPAPPADAAPPTPPPEDSAAPTEAGPPAAATSASPADAAPPAASTAPPAAPSAAAEGAPPTGSTPVAEPPTDATSPASEAAGEGAAGGAAVEIGATVQAPAAGPAADTPIEGEEEIVVTGSRVKRTSFSSAASVEVIDREQLEYSGAQNMGDVVRYMTAASGSNITGNLQGAWGTNSINLRALGTNATLILVNGRRLVASGSSVGFYSDINTIPVSVVERVEILRGGASAIYGADAVAGVVNIITRKDWDGARVEVNGKMMDDFAQREGEASMAIGSSGEHSRGGLALSYYNRSDLMANQVDWTDNPGFVESIGNPASFVILSVPEVGEMLAANPDPDCPGASLSGYRPADNMGLTPYAMFNEETGLCNVNIRPFTALFGSLERTTAFGDGEFDLTNHSKAFTELSVSRFVADQKTWPSFPVLPEVIVPADHPDNVFGVDALFFGSPIPLLSGNNRHLIGTDDTLRAVAGVRGDFEGVATNSIAEDWEWELSGTWGQSRYHADVPDTLVEEFQDALNSCGDPNNLDGCFNPFFSAYTGTGTPNSRDVIESFSGTMTWTTDSTLMTGDVGLNGSLFELPGGDLGFAIGGQLRRETRATDMGIDAERSRYGFVLGNTDSRAERDVQAGYLELVWPVYNGVELQTAGRIEHSSTTGVDGNPTVGVIIAPAEIAGRDSVPDALRRLRFRGHAATAFRSPSLLQTYQGFATFIQQFDGEGPTPLFRPTRFYGNKDLEPEKAIALSAGFDWAPIEELALTADLWHYDYDDIIVNQDAQRLHQADLLVKNDDDYMAQEVCAELPCVRRDASLNLLGVDARTVNAATVETTGVDFGAVLKLDLGGESTLSVAAQGTYVFSYLIPREDVPDAEVTLADGTKATVETEECDDETCDVAGRHNLENFADSLPKLKVNFPVTLSADEHSVALVGHYISSYENDNRPDPMTGKFEEIDAYLAFDLTYAYTLRDVIGEATTLRLSVLNALDTDPPLVYGNPGTDITNFDPRGRVLFAGVSQEF